MKVVFIAGGLYHHISDITDYLYEVYGQDFYFFATEKKVRKTIEIMGHSDMGKERSYYYDIHESLDIKNKSLLLCKEADIVIIGCGDCSEYLKIRMSTGKICFKMKERLFKKGICSIDNEKYKDEINELILPYINKDLYYLCMGRYSGSDLFQLGVSKDKLLNWGYFTYCHDKKDFYMTKDILKICWAGRFIEEKRPDIVLEIAKALKDENIPFEVEIVGYGPLKENIENLIHKFQLDNEVKLLGSMPEYEVRKVMSRNDWFIFTSTNWEGWGVVLNEAMAEGCLCYASREAGSTNELIIDGVNGFSFDFNEDYVNKFLNIIRDDELLPVQVKEKAYHFIKNDWNSKKAAQRLVDIFDHYYKTGKVVLFDKGLCSMKVR